MAVLFIAKMAPAQNTIYWEDFNEDLHHTYYLDFPSGADYDAAGYVVDGDAFADGSNINPPRPNSWFITYAFASADSLTNDGIENLVFAANSWFEPREQALNYLITPSIYLSDNTGTLSWKSAPYQTPYYCDGYKVLVSSTTNFEDQFTDTLFVAGEYLSTKNPMPDSTWNGYNFSPTGFIHGLDGTYTQFDGDSARFKGVLRPFSVSLAQYAGKKIFIAFLHDSDDDNLIAIDDIKVTGNGTVGINENSAAVEFNVYPNPAANWVNLNFTTAHAGAATVQVFDMAGKLIETRALGTLLKGQHSYQFDTSKYTNGNYLLTLRSNGGSKTLNLVISK